MSYPLYATSAQTAQSLGQNGQLSDPNVGLWWSRFYEGFAADWSVNTDSKKGFIKRTAKWASLGTHATHAHAFAERQRHLCTSLGGVCTTLETISPMVTGSGIGHPVENGFAFHPTLGLPYLPATGVKGLLRAWVDVWMFHENEALRSERLRDWFGDSADATDVPPMAGNLVFFDALPVGEVQMDCDVLTPHMGKWYEKGDTIKQENFHQVAPADWHVPVPIPFLVINKGVKFQWAIAPRTCGDADVMARRKQEAGHAMQQLQCALEWIGAGAKTAVGYGRLLDTTAEAALRSRENLQRAGIILGQEEWSSAKASWDKGRVEFKVEHNGKKAMVVQQKAHAMRGRLQAEDVARLDKGKPVLVRAIVELKGNQAELIDIQSQ